MTEKLRKSDKVRNPQGVCKGIALITVDGQPIDGNVVMYQPGKHLVEVVMGN